MSKLVGIYERNGKLFISPYHKTEAGYWVGDEETTTVALGDAGSVQEAVIAALAASREGVPTPSRDSDPTGSLLIAAGVSSWSTFAKSAKSIAIESNDGKIEITPDKNIGGRDGFIPMTDKVITTWEGDIGLGDAVLQALKIAE